MVKNFSHEIWDIPDNRWDMKEDYLNESSNKSVADGRNILAVVQGVFFVPDGISRNERYYPKKFWETILENEGLQTRINDRMMLGCIGHEDKGITESDIAEGKVSHIVTKLWIDNNSGMGMGEAHILGTNSGRNLYVLMKAGCKIKVSSRASGDYKPNEDFNGMPVVDEDSYYLETFDFVLNPGFTETNPLIKENMNKIKDEMRRLDMEFTQKIYEDLRTEKTTLNEQLIKTREEKAIVESKLDETVKQLSEKDTKIQELTEALDKAKEVETEKNTISEELETIKNHLKECEIEDITTLKTDLEKSGQLLESYYELGKPEQIKRKLNKFQESVQKWEELGVYEEIAESIPVIEHVLEEVANLGVPLKDVKEIIDRASHLVSEEQEKKHEGLILNISREYKAPIENVRSMLESLGEVQTVEILKSLNTKNQKIIKEEKKSAPKVVESKKEMSESKKPPVYNLFRQFKNENSR